MSADFHTIPCEFSNESTATFCSHSSNAGITLARGNAANNSYHQRPSTFSYDESSWVCQLPRDPKCGMTLPSRGIKAVRDHLQREHPEMVYAAKMESTKCKWPGCNAVLKRKSLVKHISNSHLAAGECICIHCCNKMSTPDALKRHQSRYCRNTTHRSA